MENLSKIKKVCGFYVSDIHLITMILPYVRKENNAKIETFLEYNLNDQVKNIISKLVINEKDKENIIKINWNSKRIQKYLFFENNIKEILKRNNKTDILVSGSRKYIEEINLMLDKYLNKMINKYKASKKEITIINLFEVKEFDNNIREMLDAHEFIINTSGIHKIEDVFEEYKKEKTN